MSNNTSLLSTIRQGAAETFLYNRHLCQINLGDCILFTQKYLTSDIHDDIITLYTDRFLTPLVFPDQDTELSLLVLSRMISIGSGYIYDLIKHTSHTASDTIHFGLLGFYLEHHSLDLGNLANLSILQLGQLFMVPATEEYEIQPAVYGTRNSSLYPFLERIHSIISNIYRILRNRQYNNISEYFRSIITKNNHDITLIAEILINDFPFLNDSITSKIIDNTKSTELLEIDENNKNTSTNDENPTSSSEEESHKTDDKADDITDNQLNTSSPHDNSLTDTINSVLSQHKTVQTPIYTNIFRIFDLLHIYFGINNNNKQYILSNYSNISPPIYIDPIILSTILNIGLDNTIPSCPIPDNVDMMLSPSPFVLLHIPHSLDVRIQQHQQISKSTMGIYRAASIIIGDLLLGITRYNTIYPHNMITIEMLLGSTINAQNNNDNNSGNIDKKDGINSIKDDDDDDDNNDSDNDNDQYTTPEMISLQDKRNEILDLLGSLYLHVLTDNIIDTNKSYLSLKQQLLSIYSLDSLNHIISIMKEIIILSTLSYNDIIIRINQNIPSHNPESNLDNHVSSVLSQVSSDINSQNELVAISNNNINTDCNLVHLTSQYLSWFLSFLAQSYPTHVPLFSSTNSF